MNDRTYKPRRWTGGIIEANHWMWYESGWVLYVSPADEPVDERVTLNPGNIFLRSDAPKPADPSFDDLEDCSVVDWIDHEAVAEEEPRPMNTLIGKTVEWSFDMEVLAKKAECPMKGFGIARAIGYDNGEDTWQDFMFLVEMDDGALLSIPRGASRMRVLEEETTP